MDVLAPQIIKPNIVLEGLVSQYEFERERMRNLYEKERDRELEELNEMINEY